MTESTTGRLAVDVLVIGWGKGGKTLAATLAASGTRVALVEQFDTMHGGTCINIGCVPTKTLVHDAEQRREDDDPQQFWGRAVARRDTVVGAMREVNHAMLADLDTVTLIDGRARFVGERTVEVAGGEDLLVVTAPVVVVNTGAVPVRPDLPGAHLPRVHDSTSLQHVSPFPRSLAVIGAGPIGLEFAAMFAGYGAEVTVLNRRERLLPDEDDEVADEVAAVLEGEGIALWHSASATRIEEGATAASVIAQVGDAERRLEVEAVLLATGRRPATDGLGLEAAGVETDERGAIVVDDRLRTSADGVFAIGDVHGGAQHTYLSLDDFRIVLSQLTGDGARSTADRVAVPTTTFLTPPLAAVGLTEGEALAEGRDVLVAVQKVATIKAMPRPKAVGDPRGIVKLVVDARTDQLLGARLFHVDAQEVINLLALAMRTGTTATQLRDGIWTHPSSTEALNETLGKLAPPE
ncbi:pyridine nucleotide-disulfide oxidoreductase [Brachybacterium ginsengisoli]|uniref:Pyridine nucleotide-disulfide oxidoreductase n=2 Tax=Brachybacterium ginsengisoli TaxID=1331682 RepID=A0A291H2G9_9MICO|nr:FAD-dependent oxidoreductase [Brachybacterium ginsengisoli]ATG56661.1 pyridine nucleotide-disulfide oxidoreductase [Brachybacterium ginsengisoli]